MSHYAGLGCVAGLDHVLDRSHGDNGRSDLVKSPEPADHRKVVDRLRRPAFLTPSCGGPSADREEKPVTRGSDMIQTRTHQEQLDI
jgi:hypothetical protein